jgi:long-chain fatty acid transport protein
VRSWTPAAAGLFAAGAAAPALGAGFAVEHQNAKATGAAYAGAQAARADAGFAVYNPAALAGIDRIEFNSNATVLWGESYYRNADAALLGSFPVGGRATGDRVLPPAFVAGSASALPVGDRLVLGLTITTPFGLRSEYDGDSVLRYYAHEAELLTVAVAPTAALALTPSIAVGASLKIEYMDLTASTVVDAGGLALLSAVPGFAPGSSDLFAEFKGDDVAFGFTAGVQIDLAPGVTAGFSFASKVEHDYEGGVDFELAGSPAAIALNAASGIFADSGFVSTLTFPATYAAGLSAAAGDRLTLLASATLTRWSVFDRLTFEFDNPAQPPEIITANWRDSLAVSVGGEYRIAPETSVRAGFMYDETPLRDRFAAPRIPDEDRRWATVGISHRFSEQISVDLAGGLIVSPKTRAIRLDGTAPGDFLRGALSADIRADTYAAALRLRYKL